MRFPIRARLTLVTTALMAVVLAAVGVSLYLRFRADLMEAVDAGLRSRAEALLDRADPSGDLLGGGGSLVEPDDAFTQVLRSDGTVVESSPGLGSRALLSGTDLGGLRGPRLYHAVVPAEEEPVPARLLAVPASGGRVVVVGASLDDQQEAMSRLAALLLVGGPLALALAGGVGWLVAGTALRPVERMRAEAAAISASQPGRRLPVPATGDEVARLGETLNAMLERLEEALERERRFVDDASHEIRTPLANLRTELELALRRSRTPEQLERAVMSAAQETERLTRLAEDLLVLARRDHGRLPVRREPVDVSEVVAAVVEGFAARSAEKEVAIETRVPEGLLATVDPLRIRQALGNLLDNAIDHTPPGGRISLVAAAVDGAVTFEVSDTGPGFPAGFLPRAFEPFARPDTSRSRLDGGTGLGLAIVRAVAEAHGGSAEARNRPEGGASVLLRIPS
jgi:two-component system OmpR family sensor kinase